MEQRELADRLDKREATVSRWVNGRSAPEAATLVDVAQLFAVDVHWLLTGEHYNREGATTAERKLEVVEAVLRGDVSPSLEDAARALRARNEARGRTTDQSQDQAEGG